MCDVLQRQLIHDYENECIIVCSINTHLVTHSLVYFLCSRHCHRPICCDEERRSMAEFMRGSIVLLIYKKKKKTH